MAHYPKPSPIGGTLIRKVIALFKARGFTPPRDEPVLIAVSGGVDSMVLAHLLSKYGRKILTPDQVTLLHLDHGWRTESAGVEKNAVKSLAKELGVGFIHRKLLSPKEGRKSSNLEEDARLKRLEVYRELAGEKKAFRYILTAHHQDDLSETVLFRFLRGELLELGQGIMFQDQECLRPFLQVSKAEIIQYAHDEGVSFFEDPSNFDSKQFRSMARREIFPLLEKAFPKVKEVLAQYPNRLSVRVLDTSLTGLRDALQVIIPRPLNRTQIEALRDMIQKGKVGSRLTLPGGVQLKRLKNGYLIENLDEANQA